MKIDPIKQNALLSIQRKINYSFDNIDYLIQALTHRSYSSSNYERFEFIGDAILNYSVAKMLFDHFTNRSEGELSRLRSNLVNEAVLAEIARELKIGDALYLGIGELKSGGFDRDSILADTMEALFAAISFDKDFSTAEKVIKGLFSERIKLVDFTNQGKDNKTILQEALQARRLALPKYRIEKQTIDGNDIFFEVSCDLGELGFIVNASATTRKSAEQDTAGEAYKWLELHHPLKKIKHKK